jgi:hypothetical protein
MSEALLSFVHLDWIDCGKWIASDAPDLKKEINIGTSF